MTALGRSLRDGMTTSMSMIGLAARPATEVLPTCSMASASSPRARWYTSRNDSNIRGHSGSYAVTTTRLDDGGDIRSLGLSARRGLRSAAQRIGAQLTAAGTSATPPEPPCQTLPDFGKMQPGQLQRLVRQRP